LLLTTSFFVYSANVTSLLNKARLNDVTAQYELATHYLFIQNQKKENKELALYWFKTAAENGDTRAQEFLAHAYQQEILTKKNDQLAVFWLTQLALKGKDHALIKLGDYFHAHKNNRIDFAELWYHLASFNTSDGGSAYSHYLQIKFDQQRQNQLSDTEQLEHAFDQNDDNQTSNNMIQNKMSGEVFSDYGLFWILWFIPLSLLSYFIYLKRKVSLLNDQVKNQSLQITKEHSSQQVKIQKQKQQISLLFNEVKRSKTKEEQQKLAVAYAVFGYTLNSKPNKQQIKTRYKQLCKIYHPDAKGTNEEMKRLNQALNMILN